MTATWGAAAIAAALLAAGWAGTGQAAPGLSPSARLHGSCAAYAAVREADFPEAVSVSQGASAPLSEAGRANARTGLRWSNRRAWSEERARLAVLREAGRPGAAPDLETLLAWWSDFVGDIPAAQREAWAQLTCSSIYDAADRDCAERTCDALPE